MQSKITRAIIPLFLTVFVDGLGWGIVYPILSPLFIDNPTGIFGPSVSIGMRNFCFELSIASYCVMMFFFAPLLGSLSDRFGRKKIILLSLAGTALGFFISGFGVEYNSFWAIILGRCVAGAASGCFPIAQAAMVDISEPSQKAARLGLATIGNATGFAVGPVVGGIFLDENLWGGAHYNWPFWFAGCLGLIIYVMLYFCFDETFVGNKQQKISLWTGLIDLFEAFTWMDTRALCGILVLFCLTWVMFFSVFPMVLVIKFGDNGAQVGYFMTYMAIFFVSGLLFLLPKLLKFFSLAKVIFTGFLIMCIDLPLILFTSHYNWLWLNIVPLMFAVSCSFVGMMTLISNHTDANHQGKIMGVTGSINAFCWGIGPVLAGVLAKYDLNWPGYLSIILIVITTIAMYKKRNA
jgi:MFS family permease